MKALRSASARDVAVGLNAVGVLVLCGVLVGAYTVQFTLEEAPCPLCLLIRLGMLATAFGLFLNVQFGPHPAHYGMALVGCVFGAAVSIRQILLHIVPGTGSYGDAVLGWHLYTWAFVVFASMILAIAVVGLIALRGQFEAAGSERPPRGLRLLATAAFAVPLSLALLNTVTTAIECGAGACPDNPTQFL